MSRLAYFRVSTDEQSIESQRHALGGAFDREFMDEGVSGGVPAAQRPGFAQLLAFVRPGDTVCVTAVDRLGRDAIDVQTTVRRLIEIGATVDVKGIGVIAKGVGEIVLAVLAQVADMERQSINARIAAGKKAAREAFAATGKTHRGKDRLGGRPKAEDAAQVAAWRAKAGASIADTATRFKLSKATVKRYCAEAANAA